MTELEAKLISIYKEIQLLFPQKKHLTIGVFTQNEEIKVYVGSVIYKEKN